MIILGIREKVYVGRSKTFYRGTTDDNIIMQFNQEGDFYLARQVMSKNVWLYLVNVGIKSHYIKTLSTTEQLIKSVNVPNFFLTMHNIALTDLSERIGIEVGHIMEKPLLEWRLRSGRLDNPVISCEHLRCFDLCKEEDIKKIAVIGERVNDGLRGLFYFSGALVASFDMSFGFNEAGEVVLVNTLTPEKIALWDNNSMQLLSQRAAYEEMEKVFHRKK